MSRTNSISAIDALSTFLDTLRDLGYTPEEVKAAIVYFAQSRASAQGGADLIERITQERDECFYDAAGVGDIDIGKAIRESARLATPPATSGMKEADEDLRQRLGEALTEVLTDEDAAPEPDWFDSREIDRVIDAILPVLATPPNAPQDSQVGDAERYQHLRDNRQTMLVTGFFGNGCINKTIEQAEEAIDAGIRAGKKG